jgi:DegT/DnrJ/EryC1/StrS aminotransferase family protein
MRLSSEALHTGGLSRELERRFKVERAVSVSRAALGLTVLLESWRERHGVGRVALPAAICHEVVVSVLAAGCQPIFCDIDPVDGLVTESEWSRARARGADVAIVVHLYGNPASAGAVRRIFPEPDCLLIDDAAQGLGSFHGTCVAGTGGDVGLLSFGKTKHIPTGNASLLFRSADLAQEVSARLSMRAPQPQTVREGLASEFRARLEIARARQRATDENSADSFSGLLEGMEPVLAAPMSPEADAATLREFANYEEAAKARVAKMELWSRGLAGTRLQPVGMGQGCVPWRYTCRLPGVSWSGQHRAAETFRAAGMHVSNWYLPAHWFLGPTAQTLSGAETLAREVFQFWLDADTTSETIVRSSAIVSRLMS